VPQSINFWTSFSTTESCGSTGLDASVFEEQIVAGLLKIWGGAGGGGGGPVLAPAGCALILFVLPVSDMGWIYKNSFLYIYN